MPERSRIYSRRDFMKQGGVAAAVLGMWYLEYKTKYLINPFFETQNLDFLNGAEANKKFPKELVGVGLNAPFIWTRGKKEIDDFFELQKTAATNKVRILPENDDNVLEPRLGQLSTPVLEKIEGFLEAVPKDTKVILPIIDGYKIFNSEGFNMVYGSTPATSPYLVDKSSPQKKLESRINFFKDPRCINAWQNRADKFIEMSKRSPNLILEIANEISVPVIGEKGIEINTLWYQRMFNYLKNGYSGIVLTGLQNPNSIDNRYFENEDKFANTVHVYPETSNFNLPVEVPTLIEEIGFPNRYIGIQTPFEDRRLRNFVIDTFRSTVTKNRIQTGGILLWQADKLHDDGFNIDDGNHKDTFSLLRDLSPKLQTAFTNKS